VSEQPKVVSGVCVANSQAERITVGNPKHGVLRKRNSQAERITVGNPKHGVLRKRNSQAERFTVQQFSAE